MSGNQALGAQTPEIDIDAFIGRRVHQLMWDQKLTQTKVGELLGMDQSSVAKRLRGKLGWSASLLVETARVLDTTVSYLVGETDGPDSNPRNLVP